MYHKNVCTLNETHKEIAINKYFHILYTISIYFSEARKITSPSTAHLSLTHLLVVYVEFIKNTQIGIELLSDLRVYD